MEEKLENLETFQPLVQSLEPLRAANELWLCKSIKKHPEMRRGTESSQRQFGFSNFEIEASDLVFCML